MISPAWISTNSLIIESVSNISSGIYVVDVNEKSPAASSGIKTGDVITSIDDIPINNMIELKEYIFSKSPGETISINISRGYIELNINVVLTNK